MQKHDFGQLEKLESLSPRLNQRYDPNFQLMHSSVIIKAMLVSLPPASRRHMLLGRRRSLAPHAAGCWPIAATFSVSHFSTEGNTNLLTSPPSWAISRTMVPEMNWYWSDGVMNMVSTSGNR